MELGLWTFVADFKGGTYIAQVEATELQAAINLYIDLEFPTVCQLAKIKPFKVDEHDRNDEPFLLNGTTSTYCTGISIPRSFRHPTGGMVLINIIKTAP